jgi:hypothetical protein
MFGCLAIYVEDKINGNLQHRVKTTEGIYKKHPKTIRLLGGKDLSENPQPTIIHKKPEPAVEVQVRRRVAIAFPAWRRRFRQKENANEVSIRKPQRIERSQ